MTAAATAEDIARYREIESLAAELALAAGGVATRALQEEFAIEYKADRRGRENERDPVSEIDRAVETTVRGRIGERFPDHAVLGEEQDDHPDPETEYLWVIDPIDGTTNFVNGFPLFAVSIGVLREGVPVAGAIWCSTAHTLNPGVYHAHAGGPLYLDGMPVIRQERQVKRRLSAAPGGSPGGTREWDHRITGSMAIEGAYAAAGVFATSIFWGPRIWDVAASVLLVQAGGGEVWIRQGSTWVPFERFEAPARLSGKNEGRPPSLRDYRQSILMGAPEAAAILRERARGPSAVTRLKRRARRALGRGRG